jgi:hypothetical protein
MTIDHGKREAREHKRRMLFFNAEPYSRYDLVRLAIDVARYPFAWPGGYVRGIIMDDGGILCPGCIRENIREIAHDTRHEGWHGTGWVVAGSFHAGEIDERHETCSHCDAEMVVW